MTAPTIVRPTPVLLADVAPGDAPASPGVDLPPDPTRSYFAGCGDPIEFILVDAHLLFGPLTPTPQLSLAEVVQRIAS